MKRWVLLWVLLVAVSVRADGDGSLQVISAENASEVVEIAILPPTSEYVSQIIFKPDGTLMATINSGCCVGLGSIVFFDLQTFSEFTIPVELPLARSIAYSPDGTLFALVTTDGFIEIYETIDFNRLYSIQSDAGDEPILNLAIDPSNTFVAIAIGAPEIVPSSRYVFQLFDIESSELIASVERATNEIDEIFGTGVIFANDQMLYLSTSNGNVYQWDVENNSSTVVSDTATRGREVIVMTSDDRLAHLTLDGFRVIGSESDYENYVVSDELDQYRWWLLVSINAHPSEPIVSALYIVPIDDGRETILQFWDINANEIVYEIQSPTNELETQFTSLAFSPDGTMLASGGADGTVRLWGVPAD